MANFDNIIQEINTNLPDNTTQAITAAKLRTTLVDLTNQIDTVQDDFENEITGTIDNFINTYQPTTVIDSLESESVTDALSAKQGSKLADAVFGEPTPEDLLQTAEIVSDNAINKTTGELQTNGVYKVYKVMYDGTYETISGETYVYQDGIAVAFYNSSTISSASYMGEYSVRGVGTSTYNQVSYEDVTIPEGCVLIATVKRGTTYAFSMTTDKRSGGLVDDMSDAVSDIEGLDNRIDTLEQQIGGTNINVECDTNLTNNGLLKTGLTRTVNNRGVTNFLALNGNTSITLVSGAFTPPNSSYCAIAFYSAEDETTVVGWYRGTANSEVNNDVVEIPTGANYARMMLMNYSVPAVIKFPSNLEVIPELVSRRITTRLLLRLRLIPAHLLVQVRLSLNLPD